MTAIDPIPTHYPRVTPYLCVDGASAAIEFYAHVFGATERLRIPAPGGTIGHAEIMIGDAVIMLSDEYPDMGILGPKSVGGTPVTIGVYVSDVDAVHARAIEAGAESSRPVEDQFYGDRAGQFVDPFGHRWSVASHIEDLTPDEIATRAAKMMGT
ncbi:MAG: VOC family protein [Polyangiales bacterium]